MSSKPSTKVVIIGSGMVGCHISNALVTSKLGDHQVRLFGSKPRKWIDRNFLTRDIPDFKYIEGNPEATDFMWCDCIVWVNDDYDDLDKSAIRMKNLTQLTKTANRKRNILISSDLIYPMNDGEVQDETSAMNFGNVYAEFENLIMQNNRWVILRPAQLYGDGIYSRIYEMCELALQGKEITVGDYKRDFCYISNLTDAVEECLTKTGINKQIFNIANGNPTRYLALGNAIAMITGTLKKEGGKSVPIPNCTVKIDDNRVEENLVISIDKYKKEFHDPNINGHATAIAKYTLPLIIKLSDNITEESKTELMNRL